MNKSAVEATDADRPRGTVLLVEDQEAVAIAARRILTRHGYAVVEARDGAEALGILEAATARVDLVLTDLTMPKMGGVELIRRLAVAAPDIPVVYMSGFADETIPPELESHTFLQKPFSIEALTSAVHTALQRRA